MKNLITGKLGLTFIFFLFIMNTLVSFSARAEDIQPYSETPVTPSPSPSPAEASSISDVVTTPIPAITAPTPAPTPDEHLTAIPVAPASPPLPEPVRVIEASTTPSQNQFNWGAFQLGIALEPQGGGSRTGFLARYQPELRFHPEQRENFFGVGFDLAAIFFSNKGGSSFLANEFDLYGAFHFNPKWEVRLFAGIQSWTGGNGTNFDLGPAFLYHFAEQARFLDGLYFSYRAVFKSPKVGIFEMGININL